MRNTPAVAKDRGPRERPGPESPVQIALADG